MKFEIAIIKWIDSTYYQMSYLKPEDMELEAAPRELISIGLFLFENDDFITICQDFVPTSEDSRMVLTIPKVSIRNYEIKTIELKNF